MVDDAGKVDRVGRLNVPITVSAILALAIVGSASIYAIEVRDFDKTMVFVALVAAGFGQLAVSFYTARTLAAVVRHDRQESERQAERDRKDANRQVAEDRREAERLAAQAEIERKRDARQESQIRFEKRREALRFGTRWNDPTMIDARKTLLTIFGLDEKDRIDFIEKNLLAVSHVLNFVEEISTACKNDVVDVDMMNSQFNYVLVNTWEHLIGWITKMRRKEGSPLWEDTEKYYLLWK